MKKNRVLPLKLPSNGLRYVLSTLLIRKLKILLIAGGTRRTVGERMLIKKLNDKWATRLASSVFVNDIFSFQLFFDLFLLSNSINEPAPKGQKRTAWLLILCGKTKRENIFRVWLVVSASNTRSWKTASLPQTWQPASWIHWLGLCSIMWVILRARSFSV